ncbi:MAG: succinyl-CoA synthetase subunit beta [Paracoccaceae bacterium]
MRPSHTLGQTVRIALLAAAGLGAPAAASPTDATRAFADHCFSPYMTAERAAEVLAPHGRVDFFDARPFSSAEPSSTGGRPPLPGTDRRCEIAFDGDRVALAVDMAMAGLRAEGIDDDAPVPDLFARGPGTALLAARFLNPARVAVVEVGTRPGPVGIETYMTVTRMEPAG